MIARVQKTDAQIQREVLDELTSDARLSEAAVDVAVNNGVATLTGTVDSWAAYLAARDAAHRVPGVNDIANELRVDVSGSLHRSDGDIAKAVRFALEWDVLVPHHLIHATIENGVVTLHGRVSEHTQYEDAERCIRNLAGIREVKNEIEVEAVTPTVSPTMVHGAIEAALHRHAQHTTRHVDIVVQDGVVTLRGVIPSWAERRAIEGAVRGTPGVRDVANELRVQDE